MVVATIIDPTTATLTPILDQKTVIMILDEKLSKFEKKTKNNMISSRTSIGTQSSISIPVHTIWSGVGGSGSSVSAYWLDKNNVFNTISITSFIFKFFLSILTHNCIPK